MHTMTEKKVKSGTIDVKALLAGDEEFLRALVRTALQEVVEAEMTEALGVDGKVAFRRKIRRLGFEHVFENLPPSIVGMEACLRRVSGFLCKTSRFSSF
jgi:hypothetical protein